MMLKKRYIVLFVVGFLIFVGLMVYLDLRGKGTLAITAPAKTPGNAKVTIEIVPPQAGADPEVFQLEPGKSKSVRVPVGNIRVNSSVGDLKGVDVVKIESFKTTKLTAPQGEQMAVQQIGTNAQYCPVLVGDAVYSYNCNGEGPIIKHGNATGTGNTIAFGNQTFTYLEPIQGGLIGFQSSAPHQLVFVDLASEQVRPVPVTNEVQEYIKATMPFITVQDNGVGAQFVLSFREGERIYAFSSIDDQTPTVLPLPKNIDIKNPARTISITVTSTRILFYAGMGEGHTEGEPHSTEEEEHPKLPCYILEYTPAGKLATTIEMPQKFGGFFAHKLANNFYALEGNDGMSMYLYADKKMQLVYGLGDVASWAIFQDKVYMQAGGTLYQFIAKQGGLFSLQSRFNSSSAIISGLYATPKGLVFTAFAGGGTEAPLNIYIVGNNAQTGSRPDIPPIASIEYEGLDGLLEFGMTTEQLGAVRTALGDYVGKTMTGKVTATIKNYAPQPHDPLSDNPVDAINFDVMFSNNQTFKARVEYRDLMSARLFIYDKSGATVFDSENP